MVDGPAWQVDGPVNGRRESLGVQWRTEIIDHEKAAGAHRIMAREDGLNGRPDMQVRNLTTAAHHQGMADGLRQAARQLSAATQ